MRIVLIDDEKRQLDYLETQIKRLNLQLEEIVKIQNPIEALKPLKIRHFDLVFLDIEMPEMTGFELIEIIGLEDLPPIIFTTAHSKYAVDAFKVNAIDYLLKPVDPDELMQSIKKAIQKNSHQKRSLEAVIQNPPVSADKRLVIAQGQTYLFVPYDTIIRIEGSGSYSDFYLVDGRKITASKRLNIYWKRLNGGLFLRPHQSHIVNRKHIQGFSKSDGGSLILKNDYFVPISSKMRDEIKLDLGL